MKYLASVILLVIFNSAHQGLSNSIPTPETNPPCANGTTYCEETPDYPSKHISELLKDLKGGIQITDVTAAPTRAERDLSRVQDENCIAFKNVIRPKMVKNTKGEWKVIVNMLNAVQQVQIEVCGNEGSRCTRSADMIWGSKTECEQRYSIVQLLALGDDQKLKKDFFKFPSHCVCKMIHS